MHIKISSTNAINRKERSVLRIYLNGIKIGEVFINTWKPLKYIQDHPKSKYRFRVIKLMRSYGVKDVDIFKALGI